MKHRLWMALFALSMTVAVVPDAQAQRGRKAAAQLAAMRGEMLAQSCFACHGPRGGSRAETVPTIGGQHETYLVASLMNFKNSDRPASVMSRLMKAYTDAEITEIADYLSKQPFVRVPQAIDPARSARGQQIYRQVCEECHTDGGRTSTMADYPILAGQRLRYLQMQMYEIHVLGRRGVDATFGAKLAKLNKDDIDAALHFFAAQR